MHKGNRALIKEINRNLVLNLIKSHSPIPRTKIADLSGLSAATVTGITAEFIARDLVHEMGTGESTGGRRPVLLRINHKAGFVVGVKLMEHSIACAITDLDANVLHHQVTSYGESHGRDLERILEKVIEVTETVILTSGVERQRLLGIGIGMAGLVDGEAGICRFSPFFGWRNAAVRDPIAKHFGLPVYLENDVNTLTIAEQWFGYGHGMDHFLVVTVGRGIGAGIVVNGQFYRGCIGGAGEAGHMLLKEDGPACKCGKHGCLEALASDAAVIRQAKEALIAGRQSSLSQVELLTLPAVVEAGEQGDALSMEILATSGRWLGIGIANLVNILNPQMVIVGGEGVCAGRLRLDPMLQAIRECSFDGLAENLSIVIEPSGDETWARGAACVVLGELFRPPVHSRTRMDLTTVMV